MTNIKERFIQSMASWRGLDPSKIWVWPLIPRLLVLSAITILIMGGGYVGLIMPEIQEFDEAVAKMATLRKDYQEKYVMAANLEKYKKLRADTEVVFGTLLKQLPNKSEMEELLNDINTSGTGRGLIFELFKPAVKENMFEFYAELPITMKLEGTYHDFGEFNAAIAHLSRIVTIHDLELSVKQKAGGGNGRMSMTAIAKTYRYLDEAEIKAQKKAKDKDKKGKAGEKGDKK